jgi:hypothetical protein
MDNWEAFKRQTFRRVFEVANDLQAHVVIAGGAAVDFRRASDVDVFVLQQPWTRSRRRSLAEDCEDMLTRLGGTTRPMDDETYVSADGRGSFYRAGKIPVPGWCPHPIHVIGWRPDTGETSVVKLLETFDLSIHAWAIDDTGRLIGCDNSTPLTKPISIVHMTPTTPERLVKLTQRYFPPFSETWASVQRSTEPMWRASRG